MQKFSLPVSIQIALGIYVYLIQEGFDNTNYYL